MARISGVELSDQWKVDYALTQIRGIGWTLAKKILEDLKIDQAKRVLGLTPNEISKISSKLDEYPTEGELTRKTRGDIQRLQVIGSYRGLRHSRGLPVRGQRTRHNARQKRGKRKTVGAFKKEMLTKMQKTEKEGKENK